MKTILISCLLVISTSCFCQTEPIKGNSKIIIKNSLTAKQNLQFAIKTILDNDFFIDEKDTASFYIKTQPKEISKFPGSSIFYNIIAKDNQIIISSMVKYGMVLNMGIISGTDNYQTLKYGGMKGSPVRKAFASMIEFASKFNGEISYL